MSGATHFIEVWTNGSRVQQCPVLPITPATMRQLELDNEYLIICKTIAIFYIKAKNKSDDNRK